MKTPELHSVLVKNIALEKDAAAFLSTIILEGGADKKILEQDKRYNKILNDILHSDGSSLEIIHLKTEFIVTLLKREYGEDTLIQTALDGILLNLVNLMNADHA